MSSEADIQLPPVTSAIAQVELSIAEAVADGDADYERRQRAVLVALRRGMMIMGRDW